VTTGPAPSSPRRSALLQTRSRETRRKLIRTALKLWGERGFERAFEETTAEDIARAAGVSKGTFYFHFAHKEDILLEMPWATAEIMIEEADRAMAGRERTGEILDQLMTSLARRVARAPRAAVLRVTSHMARVAPTSGSAEPAPGFGKAYQAVFRYACERGDLPPEAEPDELASLLEAATMDTLVRWAATSGSASALRDSLSRRADVVFSGAAVSYRR
jgi:AcrR family transcriptional regulator